MSTDIGGRSILQDPPAHGAGLQLVKVQQCWLLRSHKAVFIKGSQLSAESFVAGKATKVIR